MESTFSIKKENEETRVEYNPMLSKAQADNASEICKTVEKQGSIDLSIGTPYFDEIAKIVLKMEFYYDSSNPKDILGKERNIHLKTFYSFDSEKGGRWKEITCETNIPLNDDIRDDKEEKELANRLRSAVSTIDKYIRKEIGLTSEDIYPTEEVYNYLKSRPWRYWSVGLAIDVGKSSSPKEYLPSIYLLSREILSDIVNDFLEFEPYIIPGEKRIVMVSTSRIEEVKYDKKVKYEDVQEIKPIVTAIQTVIPNKGMTCFIPNDPNSYKILKSFGFWNWTRDKLKGSYLAAEGYKKLNEKFSLSVCYRAVYGHIPFECREYGDGICIGTFLLQGVDWEGRKYPHIHLIYLNPKDYKKLGYNPLFLKDVFIGYEKILGKSEEEIERELTSLTIKIEKTYENNKKEGNIKNIYYDPNTLHFLITYEGDLYSAIKYLYEDVLGDSLGYMGLINVDEKLISVQTKFPTIALIEKKDEEEKVINDEYFRYRFRQINLDSFRKFGRAYQKRLEGILYQL